MSDALCSCRFTEGRGAWIDPDCPLHGGGQRVKALDFRGGRQDERYDKLVRALREVIEAHDAVMETGNLQRLDDARQALAAAEKEFADG